MSRKIHFYFLLWYNWNFFIHPWVTSTAPALNGPRKSMGPPPEYGIIPCIFVPMTTQTPQINGVGWNWRAQWQRALLDLFERELKSGLWTCWAKPCAGSVNLKSSCGDHLSVPVNLQTPVGSAWLQSQNWLQQKFLDSSKLPLMGLSRF